MVLLMNKLRILVIETHKNGGASLLLDRLFLWLENNNYNVDKRIISINLFPNHQEYELAILPCYVFDDILLLKKKGVKVKRILLWDMGMGCFQDGYYNPYNTRGLKGFLTSIIQTEAEKALKIFSESKSLCFTDIVGRYNTYKNLKFIDEQYENHNIIPIGIKVPEFVKKSPNGKYINVCWVGRIAYDFKYIPLLKSIRDLDEYARHNCVNIKFTIVGNGDALSQLKYEVKSVSYDIEFIDEIEYNNLDKFFITQDIAFAMGTSALDAARNSLATVVVTPIRTGIDKPECFYRWIYESKGYSLGEYPGLDSITGQTKMNLCEIMKEFMQDPFINQKCYKYANKFNEDVVFKKIFDRGLPNLIDKKTMKCIIRFSIYKRLINKYIFIKNKLKKE